MIAVITQADLVHLLDMELTVRCTLESQILRHSVSQNQLQTNKK